MPEILVPVSRLRERLAREEQQLKQLGLHGHAAGVRAAITILIKESQEPAAEPQPSIDPTE